MFTSEDENDNSNIFVRVKFFTVSTRRHKIQNVFKYKLVIVGDLKCLGESTVYRF